MAYDYYTMQLGKDYVLSLFSNAVDEVVAKKRPDLANWTGIIMDWYEDQLEYDELDWEIESIPALVESDLVYENLVGINKDHTHYNDIVELFDDEGAGYAVEKTYDDGFYVARTCYESKNNSGEPVYLIKQSL